MARQHKRLFCRISACLTISAWLFALPCLAGAAELTLEEAVATAISNNPGLQSAEFQSRAAEEKIFQARSGYMPQVQLGAGYDRTTNPMWAFGTKLNQESIAAQDFDPDRLNDPDAIGNYSSSLSVVWPLYDSGQTWYGLKQARLGKDAAVLYEARARQETITETVVAYLGSLLARERQVVLSQTLETSRSHMKLVQSRYDGGFVAKSDLLRAKVRIADIEQQLSDARSRNDIAMCRLNVAMGLGNAPACDLTTPLEAGEPVSGSLEEWVSAALAERPDMQGRALEKQIAEREIDKSKAARHPSVNLTGAYEVNSEDFSGSGDNYAVGAHISVPLFTGGRIAATVREAEANLQRANAMLRAVEQRICAETRQAFFNARSAWERIAVAQEAVGQAEESLRIVRNRYQGGLFTITDLLDSETAVQHSRINRLAAVHDYRTALALLKLAAGTVE